MMHIIYEMVGIVKACGEKEKLEVLSHTKNTGALSFCDQITKQQS